MVDSSSEFTEVLRAAVAVWSTGKQGDAAKEADKLLARIFASAYVIRGLVILESKDA